MATDTASCSNAVPAIAASLLGGAAELKRLGKAAVLTKPRIALWPATRLATVIEQLIEEL